MKEEIDAAADFLSRIFLSHDKIAKEKIQEFNSILAEVLQTRFRDHWHESFPTKGQAYRCIRICPEEPLDPMLEKVCNQVGVCISEFQLPMELTLWVDPKEVVCKFGDLKCSYHVVAKKDQSSGTMNNQTDNMDIEDLVEGARELYQKKQSLTTHPLNSSEIHIPGYSIDGMSNRFSTALRINGTMHYNIYGTSPGSSYDGSPRGKGKTVHSPHHKRHNGGSNGFHYYGKSNGVKAPGGGGFMANGSSNGHSGMNGTSGGGFHRNHHHHHNNHHHHHHHQHHSSQGGTSPYQNSYLNGYHEDTNGFSGFPEQRSISPTKMNGVGNGNGTTSNGMPPIVPMSQGSPTPEQIQQQMQHPPPMPPPSIPPPHLHQAYNQPPPPPPTDPTSLSLPPPPPPPTCSQQTQQQSQSISSSTFASTGATTSSSSISISNNNSSSSSGSGNGSNANNNGNGNNSSSSSINNSNSNNNSHGGKMNNHNTHPKYQSNRGGSGGTRGNNRQTSPIKDVK